MTLPTRSALIGATYASLCACGSQGPVDPAANQIENFVIPTEQAVRSPNEPRRDVAPAPATATTPKEPIMPDRDTRPTPSSTAPSARPPAKAPTEPPSRVILPSPTQPPAEVDPVHRDPGDRVPL